MTSHSNNTRSDETVNISDSKIDVEYESDAALAAQELFHEYSEALLQFASASCIIFIIIGIPGNLTTILALARCKKVRNATAIFIINLHISDLIMCCMILPITVMTFTQKRWTHGVIICRMYPFFKYVLNASSIFTILAISINRYVMVCHPLMYPKLYKRRNMTIMLLILWTSSFLIFLPSTFSAWGRLDLKPNEGFCTMLKDKHHRSPKKLLLMIAFIGPYLITALCYARIWWVVRKTVKKTQSIIVRPTHLPLRQTETDTSNSGNRHISFDPTTSGNSTPEDDNSHSDNVATPTEKNTLEKYFKAPFRLTRRESRPKAPTRRDKKLFTMITAIMISFCLSHFPVMVIRIVYQEYKCKPIPNVFAHLLEFSGTCLNPLIYVLMSNEYRQAYRSLFDTIAEKIQIIISKR